MNVQQTRTYLIELAAGADASAASRFFKTEKGTYGEGDQFIGLKVPQVRDAAKRCEHYSLQEVEEILKDPIHEIRLLGGLLLVQSYQKEKNSKREIVNCYVRNLPRMNNWDLIDLTCYFIVGDHLLTEPDRSLLDRLSQSSNLWEQRAAIVSTMTLIRKGQLDDTYRIASKLLTHKHDLIHKAVGWLLREAGARDKARLEKYLEENESIMARTTLRYAIEKFSSDEKKGWLARRY